MEQKGEMWMRWSGSEDNAVEGSLLPVHPRLQQVCEPLAPLTVCPVGCLCLYPSQQPSASISEYRAQPLRQYRRPPNSRSAMLKNPKNQKRLTNVAIVRYKKGGKKFEVACYPNKVMEWRSQVEKDIDNVLQTHTVFANVSKGIQAKREDLVSAFKTDEATKVCLEILDKGQVQVAEKERQLSYEQSFRDVATLVSEKCVNPETQRPYAMSTIEQAMKDIHFAVTPAHSAKKQALEVIPLLKDVIPIERARMRVRVAVPAKEGKLLKEHLSTVVPEFEDEDWGTAYEFEAAIDPGQYRFIEGVVQEMGRGQGRVEVLELAVQPSEDVALE